MNRLALAHGAGGDQPRRHAAPNRTERATFVRPSAGAIGEVAGNWTARHRPAPVPRAHAVEPASPRAGTVERMPTPADADERAAQLEALRDEAVERLHRLDDDIAALRVDRSADNADDEHDPEGVTLSTEWARLTGLQSAAARELAEIDAAIARRGEGDDGRCVDCGRIIPPARLLARPTATRCVECATKAGA